jgi:hypothetical protein
MANSLRKQRNTADRPENPVPSGFDDMSPSAALQNPVENP